MNIIIPQESNVYKTLDQAADTASGVVFSGLLGTGKSLYINQFLQLAQAKDKKVTVIQWDVARKAFETETISTRFPMEASTVHNGLKLIAGRWLIDTIRDWMNDHDPETDMLLLEAPQVGHRFIEIAKKQSDENLEEFFSSKRFQVIVPIPSVQVREKIEADRAAQVSEDAKVWSGAKPSVMLMIWKMICGVANEMGKEINIEGQPPYDPAVYEFVFSQILKHRHITPLYVDEVFDVKIENESALHDTGSVSSSPEIADQYGKQIINEHPSEDTIDAIIANWYIT